MSKLTERKMIEISYTDIIEKEFITKIFNEFVCGVVCFIPYNEFKEIINEFTTPFPHWFQELLLEIGNYHLDDEDMLYVW